MPPSPVEIVLVAANDHTPASPQVPARRPFHEAPCACAQSSSNRIPSLRQYSAIRSTSNAMWPPMCTRNDGFRPVRARLALEVLERHAEIVAVAVHELDLRTCGHDRSRRRHERVRRAEHRVPPDREELERRQRGAGPARGGDRRQSVPLGPGLLELDRERAVRPLLPCSRPSPRARGGARGRGDRIRWRTLRCPWRA